MPSVAGFRNRVRVNAAVLRANHWTVSWKVDDFEVSTFGNKGACVYVPGMTDYTISVDGFWDTTDNPFSRSMDLTPGVYPSLSIELDKNRATTTSVWNFLVVLITEVRMDSSARDVIRLNFTAKSSASVIDQTPYVTIPNR